MPDLRETLGRLARLEAERFYLVTRDVPTVFMAHLGGHRLTVSSKGDDLSLAILAAALLELVTAQNWTMVHYMGADTAPHSVHLYGPPEGLKDKRGQIAHAIGDVYALTLATAVVQALEATP